MNNSIKHGRWTRMSLFDQFHIRNRRWRFDYLMHPRRRYKWERGRVWNRGRLWMY